MCDPIDSSPTGFSVPGVLQARTLEWVAISFSNAGKWKVKVKSLSHVWLFATPWTVAYQAPPSMGFSRHEYCSGLPLPTLMSLLYLIPINDISLFTEQLNYQTYLNSLALTTSPISSPTVLPYAFKASELAFSLFLQRISMQTVTSAWELLYIFTW